MQLRFRVYRGPRPTATAIPRAVLWVVPGLALFRSTAGLFAGAQAAGAGVMRRALRRPARPDVFEHDLHALDLELDSCPTRKQECQRALRAFAVPGREFDGQQRQDLVRPRAVYTLRADTLDALYPHGRTPPFAGFRGV